MLRQKFEVVNIIFVKNMKGWDIISSNDAEWHLKTQIFVLFLSHKKKAFKAISVEQAKIDTFHRAKLQ